MKRILITGANSYIGTHVEEYLNRSPGKYHIETIDLKDSLWCNHSFTGYDCIFHVAGIAHSDSGKISKEKEALYRSVNTDLTVAVAKKAKEEGVKQFIFMSSAIIYGNSAPFGKSKMVTRDTIPAPNNCYSDSKWQAELMLKELESPEFKICILRPPMIYGKDCKGNYRVLATFARKLPIFPKVNNARSMLYIENLCEFVRLMIENEESGVFFPQNREYTNTSDMVKMISHIHGKKILLTPVFNPALYVIRFFTELVDKAFGSLTYEQGMSKYKEEYRIVGFEESIRRTEG